MHNFGRELQRNVGCSAGWTPWGLRAIKERRLKAPRPCGNASVTNIVLARDPADEVEEARAAPPGKRGTNAKTATSMWQRICNQRPVELRSGSQLITPPMMNNLKVIQSIYFENGTM